MSANEGEPVLDEGTELKTPPPTTPTKKRHHEITWNDIESANSPTAEAEIRGWELEARPWAVFLERIALAIERPANKIIGSNQLNPLYHTGTIATFLLFIVGVTGTLIFVFFHYGYEESYQSVVGYDRQFIARTMRAVHRFASDALVITTLLHAYRTLFMERFRGPRWLAWVTGVVLTAVIWLAGVTGYWLIWDVRAQWITEWFVRLLEQFTPWSAAFVAKMATLGLEGNSWKLFLFILGGHILLFLITVGFFYLHIVRLKRPRWYPPVPWMIGLTVVLLLAGVIFPLRHLAPADLSQLPQTVNLDLIYLFFIPFIEQPAAVWLWGGLFVVTAVSLAIPWVSRARSKGVPPAAASNGKSQDDVYTGSCPLPRVQIIDDLCTGCSMCAVDCPYDALEMVEREGDHSQHKLIAVAHIDKCVSCGICVGSCEYVAVTLGHTPPVSLWDVTLAHLQKAQNRAPQGKVRLVYTCDRHAAIGAKQYMGNNAALMVDDTAVEIISVPCVGTVPPNMTGRALQAGADEVQIIGCPPADCRNREGNYWEERRLTRRRVPRLKKSYANDPITAVWVAPNEFEKALHTQPVRTFNEETGREEPNYLASRRMFPPLKWQNYVIAFALLAVILLIQIFLTDIPVPIPAADRTVARILIPDTAAPFHPELAYSLLQGEVEMRLELDGEAVFSQTFPAEELQQSKPFYAEKEISPGSYHAVLALQDEDGDRIVLYGENVTLGTGDVLRINYFGPAPSCDGAIRCNNIYYDDRHPDYIPANER